ncbi:MAG: hypothetical protein ACYC61_24850, partial [Isosphaeraceae bacterium]
MAVVEHFEAGDAGNPPLTGTNGHIGRDSKTWPGADRWKPGGTTETSGRGGTNRPPHRQTADEQLLESTELAEPSPRAPELGAFTHTE